MPIPSQYSCTACGNIQKFDVPDNAEPPQNFGDKIPCNQCGQYGKMNYNGPA